MANDREQFNAASFLADFDKDYAADTPDIPEEQGDTEPIETLGSQEEVIETDEVPETQPSEEEQVVQEEVKPTAPETNVPVNDPDVHKRNEAFKKLREEKEKLEQSDKFLADLASQYGLSKDELIIKFKEERMVKEAQKQGVPVEQFKRMQELEQQVSQIKEQYQKEAFNYEAERLVQRYNIPASEVENVFAKIGELGLDVVANPKLLDVAYKALNYEVALEKGRQTQLQETKKRREGTASPSLGTKGNTVDTSDTDADAEIEAFLKEKLGK
jgi:hypothetical protein